MGAAPIRGVALVAVLWIVVLLSTVAGGYAYGVRTELSLTRNSVQAGKARSLAQAGLNRAIVELLRTSGNERWRADGSPNQFEFASAALTARIQAASGLVDLNQASPALLADLLTAVGVQFEQQQKLVDAILDWRDGDDLHRLHGAEARDYRHSDLDYGPANRPFEYIGELALVLGMTREIYARVRPFVTVYSESPQVNRELAPGTVLLALLNGDSDAVSALLAARNARSITPDDESTTADNGAAAPGAYHLSAQARLADGTQAALQAVVLIGAADGAPYAILDWNEGGIPQRGGDA